MYDVLIVGGGPGGLSAALALGRARKRVLLCDAGPRRNALAVHIQNFVTRDGTPPDEFRRIAREQLAEYPSVTIADARVESIAGSRGAFQVRLFTDRTRDRTARDTADRNNTAGREDAADRNNTPGRDDDATDRGDTVEARRILLATGMIDEMLPIDGFRELWGHAIFQCPYCHGWEVRDRKWAFLALPHAASHVVPFARMIRGWTSDVTVFTNGAIDLGDAKAQLVGAGIALETAPIARLVREGTQLTGIELASGAVIAADVLFAQPPQQQTELVRGLGLELEDGYVKADPMSRATSIPGIYASGDLTTRGQAAILAAATGMQAAAALNVDLAME